MKPLLLALILAAAPVHAIDTEGPAKGPVSGPTAGVGAQIPALPQSLPGSLSLGAGAGVQTPGVSRGVDLAHGAGATSAGPAAFVTGAPQIRVAGPQAGAQGPSEGAGSIKPSGAPQAGEAGKVSDETAKEGASASASGDKSAAAAPQVSAESAKAQSDARFDGEAAQKGDAAPAVAAPKSLSGRVLARLGLSRSTGAKAERPKTAFDRDNYGGPQKLELSRKGKALYGLRWGLSLTGIATLIQLGLGLLFAGHPWQLAVSKGTLAGMGRVELLTGAGPHAIAQAIATHPLSFFLMQLPLSTFKEELIFRGLQFGLTFLLLTAIRPAAAVAKGFINKIPDLFGYERAAERGLDFVSRISAHAFSIAAALSAWAFATAHFAAWGVDPVTIAVHGTLGFGLAYVAYKTRSLATAFTAHLSYNVLSLGALALALLVSPTVAVVYGLGLSVVSVAGLYLHWRSYRKARGLAVANAKLSARNGLVGLLLVAMLGSSILGVAPRSPLSQAAQPVAAQSWVVPAQQPAPKAAPQQAAPKGAPQAGPQDQQDSQQIPDEIKQALMQMLGPDAAKAMAPEQLQGYAAVTAQAKQSVVEVINPGVGLGSGYVVSKDGLVLTNGHVVAGGNGVVIVQFENGMKGPAKVVAVNYDKDIAIIQLPKRPSGDWPAIAISQSEVHEGDEVLAMGHPLGLPFTVTRGIISGVGANRGNLYVEHIQTDAAINHGNSGGPLVNAKTGEVVGMNTQIASTNDGNMGLGFAISAKDLRDAIEQYRASGNINSAWLGIIVNMTGEPRSDRGVVVEQVRPGSPAAKAGIKAGDVILGADGRMFGAPKDALHQLAATIAHTKPGGKLAVAVGTPDGNVGMAEIALADKQ